MQNSMLSNKITSLYGNQTSPVVLCMQNSVLRFRITSLNLSQLSSVVLACKTATLGSELQVCMGPSPHLWFCAFKTATCNFVAKHAILQALFSSIRTE